MKAILLILNAAGQPMEEIIEAVEIWNAKGNFIWFSNKDVTVIYPAHKVVNLRIIKTSGM